MPAGFFAISRCMKTRTSFLMIFVLMGLAVSLFGAPHTDPLDVCLSYRSSLLFLEKSSQKIETGQPIPPHNSRARARFIPAAHQIRIWERYLQIDGFILNSIMIISVLKA